MILKKDCQQKTVLYLLLPIVLLLGFSALYIRTTAPSVLSGDSAEFQLVASLFGVAHPTTYPLYSMLGAVASRAIPFGDAAWRVTVVSAVCASMAVAVGSLFLRHLKLSYRAALLSSCLLGVSPGLWNAATLAEVYTLLILLMIALALAMLHKRLYFAALIAGLGFTHHGLFAITALPIFAFWMIAQILIIYHTSKRKLLACYLMIISAFFLGMTPWLYPLVQFGRYGPFNGLDYGLPRHYFWGAPGSWGQVFDLLSGGSLRRDIFRMPSLLDTHMTLSMLTERALFEFGWLGLALGFIGCIVLLRRNIWLWLASAWILVSTTLYLILLGPAVADAPIFSIPMLLPWTLYIAYAIDWLISEFIIGRRGDTQSRDAQSCVAKSCNAKSCVATPATPWRQPLGWMLFAVLCFSVIWWADTRLPYANKRHLWLYREFGEAVLTEMAPNAVVLAHWEQGMTLQYLHLVEKQRPDIWVDVVEPGDDAWPARIQRRYAGRPVYLIGSRQDLGGMTVELVYEDQYAHMFRYFGAKNSAVP